MISPLSSPLTIHTLGHQGDGLGEYNDQTIAVPYTLPGEIVEVERLDAKRGRLVKIFHASPERIQPQCPYFTRCGSCHLQHMSSSSYLEFKRQKIIGALIQQGLGHIAVKDPILLAPHSRRRVSLKAIKHNTHVKLGYYQQNSHEVVDIHACPLIVPEISALLEPLKFMLNLFLTPKEKSEIFILKSANGLDVVIKVRDQKKLSLPRLESLLNFAQSQNLAALHLHHGGILEPLVIHRPPYIKFNGVPVRVSALNFLQVSDEMDSLCARLVTEALPNAFNKGVDLFCGRGTLTFPLAQWGPMDGYELDSDSIRALNEAASGSRFCVEGRVRNLFSHPLTSHELEPYTFVCLNPPREGASAQVKNLASSSIGQILMLSCNQASFARDARVLIDAGYQASSIQPIDQFLWSPHIELFSVFKKG